MAEVLDVRGLRYELQGRALVDDVSFAVDAGETLVLLGRSGSGKSTTLRLINRLLTPAAGTVRIRGDDAATQEVTQLRRRIGYVIQDIGLFPHFTVAENAGLPPRPAHWPPPPLPAPGRRPPGRAAATPPRARAAPPSPPPCTPATTPCPTP